MSDMLCSRSTWSLPAARRASECCKAPRVPHSGYRACEYRRHRKRRKGRDARAFISRTLGVLGTSQAENHNSLCHSDIENHNITKGQWHTSYGAPLTNKYFAFGWRQCDLKCARSFCPRSRGNRHHPEPVATFRTVLDER